MAGGKGISGLSIALATGGGILVYAGFRGVNPIQALRGISGGNPPAVSSTPVSFGSVVAGAAAAGLGATVSSAAAKYTGDKYSQAKRTQKGWSDCSSFCDKILTDIGIPPPVKWASTSNFRITGEWKTIPLSQTMPGDIAVNSHHMVMITAPGGTAAIGQQNPRVNVRTGSVNNLIDSYVCKRYIGKR